MSMAHKCEKKYKSLRIVGSVESMRKVSDM